MQEHEKTSGSVLQDRTSEKDIQRAGKYLTFKLAAEEYGLEILKVKEIIGLLEITKVPRMPANIRGMINLRGKVIPVIDLRCSFAMDKVEDTNETCIIVVVVHRAHDSVLMGCLVDSVSEVLNIAENEIEDTPSFGSSVNTDFILGIGKTKEKVVMLLDIERVLTADDVSIPAQELP